MLSGRKRKVQVWLEEITNELNSINNIFLSNLISKDDIGENNYMEIIDNLYNVNEAIEEALFDIDNGVIL